MKNKKGKPYVFQLQTMPASCLSEPLEFETPVRYSGMKRFRKEIIRVGKYIQPALGQTITVSLERLNHWVTTFNEWVSKGHRVFVPLGHEQMNDPSKNQGWVTSMAVEGNGLYAIMEL